MDSSVSIDEKKKFIRWFLNHFTLKKRETGWVLNYLVNYPKLLANVHFVESIKHCSRSIVISTTCSKEPAFRFQKNKLITDDADKAFHDIRMNRQEPLYMKLNFKGAKQSIPYRKVLVDNPFMKNEDFITDTDRKIAEAVLNESLFNYKRKKLLKEIDAALDELNQEEFLKLSKQLRQLDESKPSQPKLQKQ